MCSQDVIKQFLVARKPALQYVEEIIYATPTRSFYGRLIQCYVHTHSGANSNLKNACRSSYSHEICQTARLRKNVIFHLHIFYICLPKHLARCLSRPSFFTECQHWSWPWHRLALLFCCDYRSALELLHDSSLQESVLLSIVEIVNDEWLFRSL